MALASSKSSIASSTDPSFNLNLALYRYASALSGNSSIHLVSLFWDCSYNSIFLQEMAARTYTFLE